MNNLLYSDSNRVTEIHVEIINEITSLYLYHCFSISLKIFLIIFEFYDLQHYDNRVGPCMVENVAGL